MFAAQTPPSRSRQALRQASSVVVAIAFAPLVRAEMTEPHGERIYSAKCASCHGVLGEGTADHTQRLEGDLSTSQLAEIIRETMPENEPGTLSANEAEAVAAYIHEAFYSAIARARNQPARIELARLTVRQYQQALADLIGSFRPPSKWGKEQGLTGEYFNSREPQGAKELAVWRIDSQVDFRFGAAAPMPEIADARAYSIRWSGSLLAPETGDYEFIVETEQAARLWVNRGRLPTIDAWVKSGNETEYKAAQHLIGGRVYPIRLEFTKSKQGVDDSAEQAKKKEKPPVAEASVALRWQRPQGVVETIPARYLSPEEAVEEYICEAPFPPDDRSYGWERGTTISRAWDEATTAGAIDVAAYIGTRLNELAGTQDDADDRLDRLKAFCVKFAERAFRQPLGAALTKAYIERQFEESSDSDAAVRRVVLLVLKSPRFLYREVDDVATSHDVAARLAFGLWNSVPDADLLKVAMQDELKSPEQVRRQAERMLADRRTKVRLREFLLTWLHVDTNVDVSKDSKKFPDFDRKTIADLRASLELFLDEVVWSEGSDYRDLLLSDEVYMNGRLVRLYGADAEADETFRKVQLDDGGRAGVLTHPYMMARFAHGGESSPIHRGVFLARGVLGRSLRPPPEAFAPLAPELHPNLTTRERVTLQTKSAECMSCHRIINPLGFTLERFNGLGQIREIDRDKPVDDTTTYRSFDGSTVNLRGARALGEFLASCEECHRAFVEQMFHHLVQQPVQAYGAETLDELQRRFIDDEFNIRKLAVEIMVASALVGRETGATARATE